MLNEYLSQEGLVRRILTLNDLERRIKEGRPINIMMGQTFDDGHPSDLLKYSLFMMNLRDLLEIEGVEATTTILLADHFMTDFNKDMSKEDSVRLGRLREEFLERVNRVYGGDINVVYSSRLSKSSKYRKLLRRLGREGKSNLKFREALLQSVPEKYRGNPDALKYPFEEVACIAALGADVKVGPNYEIKYDVPAREAAPMMGFDPYVAIHLTNSRLFGEIPELDEDTKEGIEEFGILPYQFRSKGLMNHRINLGDYNQEEVDILISSTEDEDSLRDLIVIAELARQRVDERIALGFFENKQEDDLELDELRNLAKEEFHKYIAVPMGYK
ncbi:MAG: hypothetical protein KKG75_05435 [Nanoarchaeota archaeon]|nr:hypothetical protein [Nanoarchaeota archaeon]